MTTLVAPRWLEVVSKPKMALIQLAAGERRNRHDVQEKDGKY